MTTKIFPYHPATIELHAADGRIKVEVNREFSWTEEPAPTYSYVATRDFGADQFKEFLITEIIRDIRGHLEAKLRGGTRIIVRPYDPYDPVRAAISAIPLPKATMQDWMQGGWIMLYALVDDNGDVATMMLDSPLTSNLRYDGLWILMTDPEAISDYDIVKVEDTALDLYDQADAMGNSVHITSMPVDPKDDFRVTARYLDKTEANALQPLLTESITASAELTIPVIAQARDLPAAIDFANEHPEFQWYVERRAKALHEDMTFPWRT